MTKDSFNINNYDGTYVMHCPTEEAAIIFLSHLDSIGKTWSNRTSYNDDNYYSKHGSKTCYRFVKGFYGSLEFYQSVGCTILEFDNFDWGDDLNIDKEDTDILNSFLKDFSTK